MRIQVILLATVLTGSVAFAPAAFSSSADQAQDQGTVLSTAPPSASAGSVAVEPVPVPVPCVPTPSAEVCPRLIARYDNPAPGAGTDKTAATLPVGSDGIAIVGDSTRIEDDGTERPDLTVVMFDLEGNLRWATTLASPGSDIAMDGLVVGDELILVGGALDFEGSGLQFPRGGAPTVVALDVDTGEEVWRTNVGGGAAGIVNALSHGPSGQVLVAGTLAATTSNGVEMVEMDAFIASIDGASGAVRWHRGFDDPAHAGVAHFTGRHDLGVAVVSAAGEAVLVAESADADGQRKTTFVGFDAATGQQQWAARADSVDDVPSSHHVIEDVATDGDVIVATGSTRAWCDALGSCGFAFLTVAADRHTGETLWSRATTVRLTPDTTSPSPSRSMRPGSEPWSSGRPAMP